MQLFCQDSCCDTEKLPGLPGGAEADRGFPRGAGSHANSEERNQAMLWTIFVILLVLWLLGMVTSYTLGGFIHILLVVAIVIVLIRVIRGDRAV